MLKICVEITPSAASGGQLDCDGQSKRYQHAAPRRTGFTPEAFLQSRNRQFQQLPEVWFGEMNVSGSKHFKETLDEILKLCRLPSENISKDGLCYSESTIYLPHVQSATKYLNSTVQARSPSIVSSRTLLLRFQHKRYSGLFAPKLWEPLGGENGPLPGCG